MLSDVGEGKTLEEKIDLLNDKLEKDRQERGRDRILSKVDSLYFVFVTLIAFVLGLVINQRSTVSANPFLLYMIIGVLLSMSSSFIVGVRGMIKNSLQSRILAWCLCFTCLAMFSQCTLSMLIMTTFGVDTMFRLIVAAVIGFLGGFLIAIAQFLFSFKFAQYLEMTTDFLDETGEWKKFTTKFRTINYGSIVVAVITAIVFFTLI